MAKLYGREMTRRELMSYVGDASQVAGARSVCLQGGRQDGVQAVEVKTGSGFNFTVLPSRCLDIVWASYNGMALDFVSPTGVVAPAYFDDIGDGFLRSFTAGLLTTCGLRYFGKPEQDGDEALGLHGRIANAPAEDVCVQNSWNGDDLVITVKGRMREAMALNYHLVVSRTITAKMGENRLFIEDEVENVGFEDQPLMVMYHCNFGYPILSEHTRLITSPCISVVPRTEMAAKDIDSRSVFEKPEAGYEEQCYFYDFEPDDKGLVYSCLFNETLGGDGVGAYVRWDKKLLPLMVQWKNTAANGYVCGMEPCTNTPDGRKGEREKGLLQTIVPGEIRRFAVEIGVVAGEKELKAL